MKQDFDKPLSSEEFEELDGFLESLKGDYAVTDASMLDGVLTASLLTPKPVPMSILFSVIWGGEENAPEWESIEELQHMTSLILRFRNSIVDSLAYPKDYHPLFLEDEEGGTVTMSWCIGFVMTLMATNMDLGQDPVWQDLCAPILLQGTDDGFADFEKMDAQTQEFWQEEVCPAVLRLHQYVQKIGPSKTTLH